jgi:hypothetical protein
VRASTLCVGHNGRGLDGLALSFPRRDRPRAKTTPLSSLDPSAIIQQLCRHIFGLNDAFRWLGELILQSVLDGYRNAPTRRSSL